MSDNDQRQTEPEGTWPPDSTSVILFCIAVMALAVPWAWWALR